MRLHVLKSVGISSINNNNTFIYSIPICLIHRFIHLVEGREANGCDVSTADDSVGERRVSDKHRIA